MANLLEYVGYVHIYLGPYRGNPIALYLMRSEKGCRISPKAYPWNDVIGIGESPNKAAADFEEKWKGKGLTADMYSGPSWEGGIKPEKPAPPKPTAPPKPASPPGAPPQAASAPPAGTGGTAPAPSPSAKVPAKTSAQQAPASPAETASPPAAPAKTPPAQPASATPGDTGGDRSQAPDPPAPAKPPTPAAPQGHPKS